MEAITPKVFPILQKILAKLDGTNINLSGDRDIEWSWVASNMPTGPGKALDFGCGPSYLALIAARKGFDTTATDIQPIHIPYKYANYRFVQGDILSQLATETFDLMINCSTIEHVGLAGRYGVSKDESDADIQTMKKLAQLLKKDGLMLLTIPVGQDTVFYPMHRVYGKKRVPLLLDNYSIKKEEFWIKNNTNIWIKCNKEIALNFRAEYNSLNKIYGLGLFVLGKK